MTVPPTETLTGHLRVDIASYDHTHARSPYQLSFLDRQEAQPTAPRTSEDNTMQIQQACQYLEEIAPLRLAEEWDNVGLLVGDRRANLSRLMTCLTITPATVSEAIEARADLIVAHHPMPFRPTKRLTTDNTVGRILLDLIQANIAVYSPHTAWDSAISGINQALADGLNLSAVQPLRPRIDDPEQLGSGRYGEWPESEWKTLQEAADLLKQFLQIDQLQFVGDPQLKIKRVAVACGSAGDFLGAAKRKGCQLFVTGETNFHTCLEVEALEMGMLLPGHFASERFSLQLLADRLATAFPDLKVWASQAEQDPVRWA